jgi:cell division protease FtsH
LVALIGFVLVSGLINNSNGYVEEPTSKVVTLLMGDAPLKEVVLVDGEQVIRVETKDNPPLKLRSAWVGNQSQQLVERLNQRVDAKTLETWRGENPQPSMLSTFLFSVVPFLILGVLLFFMLNNMGGNNRVMGFGKSRAKLANKETPQTTFEDVAGVPEAIEELQEIKDFLAEPAKFKAFGAKIPKGVLLYGPPGTGKTLLARAVAGEAKVPFLSISGSDFVEMFVGVGASRVRDLFEQAKEAAPAIVFIDEIDAVGRHRGAGMGGGHDEPEQTLNQLLVELDGFDEHGGVVLIAATNRPDVLDPALLRPGRFDRQIPVEAPDMEGREKILRVHAANKPIGPEVDLGGVAQRTPGFTGADLANALNEAALLAARQNRQFIGKEQMDEAIDRVIAGPQKRSRVMNDQELLITAYHEGGHALVAAAMPGNDPVQKVTILPRGRALGYTMVMPDADKYSTTRNELLDQLAYMLGGRAAEELVFHDPTTGASNDIEKATKVARAMVTQYGMTERLGSVRLGTGDQEPFLGRDYGHTRDYSEAVAAIIDDEVSKLIERAHQEAYEVLQSNREVLDELVRQLLEKETLDKQQVAAVFEPLKRWPERQPWTGSSGRTPSDVPPVKVPPRPEPPSAAATQPLPPVPPGQPVLPAQPVPPGQPMAPGQPTAPGQPMSPVPPPGQAGQPLPPPGEQSRQITGPDGRLYWYPAPPPDYVPPPGYVPPAAPGYAPPSAPAPGTGQGVGPFAPPSDQPEPGQEG